MPKLTGKIYQDKNVVCAGCGCIVGAQRLDGQILKIGKIVVFNYLAWQCRCGRYNQWRAPLLPDEDETFENLFPDVEELRDRSQMIASKYSKLCKLQP